VGLGGKESQRNGIFGAKKRKEGEGEGKGRFLRSPPPPPSFVFWLSPHFSGGKTPKIPFLGLSLLPNPTETLATQAKNIEIGLLL